MSQSVKRLVVFVISYVNVRKLKLKVVFIMALRMYCWDIMEINRLLWREKIMRIQSLSNKKLNVCLLDVFLFFWSDHKHFIKPKTELFLWHSLFVCKLEYLVLIYTLLLLLLFYYFGFSFFEYLKLWVKVYRYRIKDCGKWVQIQSFFWSVFYCIRTEYGDLRSKSPY